MKKKAFISITLISVIITILFGIMLFKTSDPITYIRADRPNEYDYTLLKQTAHLIAKGESEFKDFSFEKNLTTDFLNITVKNDVATVKAIYPIESEFKYDDSNIIQEIKIDYKEVAYEQNSNLSPLAFYMVILVFLCFLTFIFLTSLLYAIYKVIVSKKNKRKYY